MWSDGNDLLWLDVNDLRGRTLDNEFVDHDAFREGALGAAGWSSYGFLRAHQGISERDLAVFMGVSASTAHRSCQKLERYGLAVADGKEWRRVDVGMATLDDVAVKAGTAGTKERERARFLEERDAFDRSFEEHVKRMWPGRTTLYREGRP